MDYVRKLGLNVIFAHLGYQKINNIWLEGEAGEGFVERYKNDLKLCRENGIDLVCMHLTSKSEAPEPNEIGLKRFQEIADYAQELGIKIAFENTKIKGYQEYILKNIKNDNVGICLDSGHLHAHFKDEFDWELFKNRIFAIHLHDNDATDDQHLIPFDGNIEWKEVIKKLKEANYNGPVTLELCYRREYLNITQKEFYEKAYKIGKELSKMFEQE